MIREIRPQWFRPFTEAAGLPEQPVLRGLGEVVILAGPNGAGKSRILRTLKDFVNQVNTSLRAHENGVRSASIREIPDPSFAIDDPTLRHRAALAYLEELPQGDRGMFSVCELTLPRGVAVQNGARLTLDSLKAAVDCCREDGLRNPYEHQHAFLDSIARRLELQNRADKGQHSEPIEQATRFNNTLREFLGECVRPVPNSAYSFDATLFKRAFIEEELSVGQKVLIAWAIALHEQATIGNRIVLIDEPENHLHPDACLKALDRLREFVRKDGGQIWIATHSPAIIAWAGSESLYCVSDGKLSYSGNNVQHVIDSLSGGKDRRETLRSFLAEADTFGFYHFVGQCLLPPDVLPTAQKNDPQAAHLWRLINSTGKTGRVRILDYGSGKGRLAKSIAAALPKDDSGDRKLHYFLWDPDPKYLHLRREAAQILEGVGASAVALSDLSQLRVSDSRVDLVVLCNVLHEIPPGEWRKTFSDIEHVLKNDGSVAIIEDLEPSVGELPHAKGFFLLDANEIAELFGGHKNVASPASSAELPSERIMVACIKSRHLKRISDKRIRTSIANLRLRAREHIQKFRGIASPSPRDGRLHALYVMLAYNASDFLG